MKENIKINKFESIKNIDIDIKNINILIGPHSTGKTTSVLVLKYFRTIFLETFQTIYDKYDRFINNLDKEFDFDVEKYLEDKFKEIVTMDYNAKLDNVDIVYEIENNKFSLKVEDNKFIFEESFSALIKEANDCKLELKNTDKQNDNIIDDDSYEYVSIIRKYLNKFKDEYKIILDKVIYIPAARSVAFLLKGYSKDIDVSKNLLQYYKNFESSINRISSLEYDNPGSDIQKMMNIGKKILGGEIKEIERNGDTKKVLRQDDGKDIEFRFLSSGQQESLPIVSILSDSIISAKNINQNSLIIIEEPEAHLHPEGQKYIIELIALFFNLSEKQYKFMITTHSPFIIDNFNNHILAHRMYKKNEEVKNVIPENEMIDIENISAYSLNGESKNIKEDNILGQGSIQVESMSMIKKFSDILDATNTKE